MPVPEHCPLCGLSQTAPTVIADKVFGGRDEQHFYLCPQCGVAYLYPPLTDDEERDFYRNEFEKFMGKRAGGEQDWSGPEKHIDSNRKQYERRLPFFADLRNPGKRVLEIGCSSGFMLFPLVEVGMDVAGVEPSGVFSEYLQQRGIKVYEDISQIAEEPGAEASFDTILHFFVLEHIRQPIEFLNSALRLLRPGGTMVFEVPSRTDPLATIYNIPAFQDFYWSVAHHYYFDPVSLRYVLDKLGESYEIIPEQRYDLSNHMVWALEGRPGGQGRYKDLFTEELQTAYLESMRRTGHMDTMFVRINKGTE